MSRNRRAATASVETPSPSKHGHKELGQSIGVRKHKETDCVLTIWFATHLETA